jgi:hypothetical protein
MAKSRTGRTTRGGRAGKPLKTSAAATTTGTTISAAPTEDMGTTPGTTTQGTATAGTATAGATGAGGIRVRLASVSPDAAMGQTLAREIARLDRKLLIDTARGLIGGQLTLQGVLGSFATASSRAVESAIKESQRAAAQEALLARQLGDNLQRLRTKSAPPRPHKNDYIVSGQVMHTTGEPAVGLAVEVIDKDVFKHDVLGAAVTDEKGSFQVTFPKKAHAESGEKELEIVLVVGIEGQPPMHVTEPTRMLGEGREATVILTLPEAARAAADAAAARLGTDIDARLLRVEHRRAVSAMQDQQLGGVMREFQAGLSLLVAALQPAPKLPKSRKRTRE